MTPRPQFENDIERSMSAVARLAAPPLRRSAPTIKEREKWHSSFGKRADPRPAMTFQKFVTAALCEIPTAVLCDHRSHFRPILIRILLGQLFCVLRLGRLAWSVSPEVEFPLP